MHTIGSFYFFALMIVHDIPMDMHMVFVLFTLPLEWSGENNFISLPKNGRENKKYFIYRFTWSGKFFYLVKIICSLSALSHLVHRSIFYEIYILCHTFDEAMRLFAIIQMYVSQIHTSVFRPHPWEIVMLSHVRIFSLSGNAAFK